jgi:hypothetical protein
MMLYHFTSLQNHWAIQRDQEIRTTESNIGSGRPDMPPFGEHVGPDVVWLTTRESPKRNGLEHPPGALVHHAKATGRPAIEWDKTRIRITVDLPANEVARWSVWSKRYRMHPKWRKAMETGNAAGSWWVIERPIRGDEIVHVEGDEDLAKYLDTDEGDLQ